jgi:hypothetical protein
MRSGTPGLNAWESQPNPMRVSMVSRKLQIPIRRSATAENRELPILAETQAKALALQAYGKTRDNMCALFSITQGRRSLVSRRLKNHGF